MFSVRFEAVDYSTAPTISSCWGTEYLEYITSDWDAGVGYTKRRFRM